MPKPSKSDIRWSRTSWLVLEPLEDRLLLSLSSVQSPTGAGGDNTPSKSGEYTPGKKDASPSSASPGAQTPAADAATTSRTAEAYNQLYPQPDTNGGGSSAKTQNYAQASPPPDSSPKTDDDESTEYQQPASSSDKNAAAANQEASKQQAELQAAVNLVTAEQNAQRQQRQTTPADSSSPPLWTYPRGPVPSASAAPTKAVENNAVMIPAQGISPFRVPKQGLRSPEFVETGPGRAEGGKEESGAAKPDAQVEANNFAPQFARQLAGDLPFDGAALKLGVEKFFARLESLGKEWAGFPGWMELAPYFLAVALATTSFELARRQMKKQVLSQLDPVIRGRVPTCSWFPDLDDPLAPHES
jgi:hypothetical protein